MEDGVEQARSLLRKMVLANREQNYQGIFTYEHSGVFKAIRITHVVHDGLEYEKLLYLNGPRKEIVRRGIAPDCKAVGDKFLRGLSMPVEYASNLEAHYELFLRGEDRVGDRAARIVHVVPKDNLRYGYILAIDKETGVLLQTLLVGTNRRVIERFQYVDIHFNPAEADVAALLAADADVSEACLPETPGKSAWQASWLPPGFELAGTKAAQDGKLSLSYTDGLSFVSVFVDGEANQFPEIQAQRGATVAQLSKVVHDGKEYAICVVGEVPPETAAKIAQYVIPAKP